LLVLLLGAACATPGLGRAQARKGDAVSAVVEAMFFRRALLEDTLRFDACSVFEHTGRPTGFLAHFRWDVQPMLDRPVDDPCRVPQPGADDRFRRFVRVTSVVVADSTAEVHLRIFRSEWAYSEVYFLAARAGEVTGWALREVRLYPGIHITAPPPRDSTRG